MTRQEIIYTITKRIESFVEHYRQNIALVGKDRDEIECIIRKSILKKVDSKLTLIYLNPSYIDAYSIFKNVSYSILSQCLGNLPKSLDDLITISSEILPSTVTYIKEKLKKSNVKFAEVLEVINKFISETGKKCILVIDEFLSLEEIFVDFYHIFSQFIIIQKKCLIILLSSQKEKAKKILHSKLNLLFGNFEILSLDHTSFSYRDCKQLIDELSLKGFPTYIVAFLVYHFNSNLNYYEIFVNEIKKGTYEEMHNHEDILIDIFAKILYRSDSFLFRKFLHKLNYLKERYRDYRDLIKILFVISEGYTRKNDIAFFLNCDKKRLTTKIQRLLDSEIIENVGNIYFLDDYLFSLWLSKVFKLHQMYPIIEEEKRLRIFKNNLKEEIAIFKEEFQKDKIERMKDLFTSFRNDVLTIDKRKIKLPHLDKIKLVFYPERKINMLIGEGNEIVLVGIKEEMVNDSDIIEFIRKGDFIKNRKVKKIFVSLEETSDAIRLLAKEGKILLWDINEINKLLRIYNRPIFL